MKRALAILPFLLLLSACNNDVEIVNPSVDPGNFIGETNPLSTASKAVMDGVYEVTEGAELLGSRVVVKWTRDRLSVFSGKDGGYIVLDGGSLDSVIFFAGYWRYATNSETGVANFYISRDEGGSDILAGDTTTTGIVLTGSYGNGTEMASRSVTLRYERPFSAAVKQSAFEILAHRGGGRNSEYLGVSENSIEMIAIAERFGSTGVEIDLRLSKDGVPFLYHDKDVNLRLTQKSLIWGNVEDFTWPQLRSLLTLRNGEKIPTAREALEYVLEETTLKVVWLDTKDIDVIAASIALQREILDRAALMGRDLSIYIGLPAQDVYDGFAAIAGHDSIPSLCELTINQTRQVNASVWAPRWTQGTQSAQVTEMHNEGRKAFVWTLDETNYIEEFVTNGQFDGILTNYPTIVSYYHYIRQ